MSNFTKRDLTLELSERTGQTQNQTNETLQTVLDLITDQLAGGNDVTLRKFGTFEIRVSKPKLARKPGVKGSEMMIPARAVVKFRPSTDLKSRISDALPKLTETS